MISLQISQTAQKMQMNSSAVFAYSAGDKFPAGMFLPRYFDRLSTRRIVAAQLLVFATEAQKHRKYKEVICLATFVGHEYHELTRMIF